MKSTASQFQEWQNTPLPLEAIAGSPVLKKAQALTAGTGIPFDAALLLTMMTVVAAVGPARQVYSPLGYSVPVSMNVILVAEPSALLNGVARREFSGFHKLIQAEVRRAGHEDSRRRGEDLIQTRIQLLMTEDILSGRRAPKIELGPLSEVDPEIAAEYTARAMPHAMQEARALKEKLETTLVGLTMASCPYLVADSLRIEELCVPERVSFDSAIVNLSFGGETMHSIHGASLHQILELGRVMAASWVGTAPFSLSATRSHRPMVSNLWLASREEACAFLEDQTFIDSGISTYFGTVEAQAITAAISTEVSDLAGWSTWLNFLLTRRFAGQHTEHRLSEEAVASFVEFIKEVDSMIPEIPPQSRCSAKHWPDMALKIALGLHLGACEFRTSEQDKAPQPGTKSVPPEPIPAHSQTVSKPLLRLAVAVTKRIAATRLRLLASPDNAGQAGAKPDREVEKMRGKLKLHGPMRWHDLLRKYNKQKSDLWLPVLHRGLASGWIVQEGNILSAADFSVSKNVSVSTGSSVSAADFSTTGHLDNPQPKNGV